MKLYAYTRSERAGKGQGGNKFLDITIRDEEQQILSTISVVAHETTGNFIFRATTPSGERIEEVIKTKKGEKKKGEQCKQTNCNNTATIDGFCSDCFPL